MNLDDVFTKIAKQNELLRLNPLMTGVYKVASEGAKSVNIYVLRNMPFEFLNDSLNAYLGFNCFVGKFDFSGYDPALTTADTYNGSHDLVIFWIDWRYLIKNKIDPVEWLLNRVNAIRVKTSVPIIINNWPYMLNHEFLVSSTQDSEMNGWALVDSAIEKVRSVFSDFYLFDLKQCLFLRNIDPWDCRLDKISSYPFSKAATMLFSQWLGNQIIPQLFLPRIKAIFLDLDNTLYSGVLGEDERAITLSDFHYKLQNLLKAYRRSGVLLALVTKNKSDDVLNLLSRDSIMPLSKDDFSLIKANWGSKSDSIAQCLVDFNFSEKDCIFIDDNPAEIAEVNGVFPDLNIIHAFDKSGQATFEQLLNFPRLFCLKFDSVTQQREKDITAQVLRRNLLEKSHDKSEYIKALEIQIKVVVNDILCLDRCVALSTKTNQFNLALQRFNEGQIQNYFIRPNHVFSVYLKDRFADSGLIGIYLVRIEENILEFSEVLFSCRALGREIESVGLLYVLRFLRDYQIKKVVFVVKAGDRNEPSLKWYEEIQKNVPGMNFEDLIAYLESKVGDYPGQISLEKKND